MYHKFSVLSIALLILASSQVIAAETATISEFDTESLPLPSDVEQHQATETESSYAIAQASETPIKLSGFTKTKDQHETASTQFEAAPIPSADFSHTASPLVITETTNSDIDPQKYLDLGYYSPLKDLFWNADNNNGTQIAQTPEVAPPPPLYPSTQATTPIATPAMAKPVEPAIQPTTTTAKTTEPSKWGYGIHTQLSTTGFIGADVGYKFSPNLNARLGINTLGFSTNYSSQGIDYNTSFTPTNIHLLGDYFPFGGGLRLTGGLVIQNNNINATGKSNSTSQIVINNTTYNSTDIGTLEAKGSFANSIAPYIGIGFGTPISPGLGFNLDAGVMFSGSPTVKLRATNPNPILSNQINTDVAAQEQKTNQDIQGFSAYPVISIGVSYAF